MIPFINIIGKTYFSYRQPGYCQDLCATLHFFDENGAFSRPLELFTILTRAAFFVSSLNVDFDFFIFKVIVFSRN